MKASLYAIVLLAGAAAGTGLIGIGSLPYSLTSKQKDAIVADIENTIFSVRLPDEDGNLYYPFVAGFTRLSFHQCATGRCVGCINVNDANNMHLSRYIEALEPVRKRNPYIRYSDLWALAGIVAVQVGERLANSRSGRLFSYTKLILFRYGRKDCPTAPYTTDVHEFPSFAKGLDHVTAFFSRKFGMQDWEVVALLGVHKLGGLRNPASGRIVRQWAANADSFDNGYYVNMVDSKQGWRQSSLPEGSNGSYISMWTNGFGKRVMFNSDMCLLKDLSFVRNNEGQANCNYNTCKASRTAYWVNLFALSNDVWLAYFVPAYGKLLDAGYAPASLLLPKFCMGLLCF